MKILTRLVLALLVVIGVIVGTVYMAPDSKTANVTFTYQRATEYEDGTPLSLQEIKYTRLYCDGKQVAEEEGADGNIATALTAGSHNCYGTHVDINYVESRPSSTVTKLVEP